MREKSPEIAECWALVQRVADSVHLRRAARPREILLFVSRRFLDDGCKWITEQEVGVYVFGRDEGYDTSSDTIVRVTASKLRKCIITYFENDGIDEPVTMEIPRGSYIPAFTHRTSPSEHTSHSSTLTESSLTVLRSATAQSLERSPQNLQRHRWVFPALIFSVAMTIALAIIAISLWIQDRALHHSIYAWQYQPSVAAFWSDFLGAAPDTDIVLPDMTFSAVQHEVDRQYSLTDYLNRSYIFDSKNLGEEKSAFVSMIAGWDLTNPYAFRISRRIMMLDPLGRHIRLFSSREYTPALVNQDNVILIGPRLANPWDGPFEGRMNFTVRTNYNFEASFNVIVNRAPAAGERVVYDNSSGFGYCVIAYLPILGGNGRILLIEATTPEANEAGGEFLLSEDQMSSFRKKIGAVKFPYFEVLLKVFSFKETPVKATIEAYRIYPNMN